jgi:hypothetical protein
MERLRELDTYQKIILILLVVMTLGFIVPYATTVSRVGYEYMDTILVPSEENGNTLYSGEINGQTAIFTVSPGNTVTFQYGNRILGTYTATREPSLSNPASYNNGVEVRRGEEILFRGSVRKTGYGLWLTNEDGTSHSDYVVIISANGYVQDSNGNVIDPMEPSVSALLELMDGPELTHKGSWWGWVLGMVLCVMSAISILFADELFRWNLSFRVRYAYDAEPSDWEIDRRMIGWGLSLFLVLFIYIKILNIYI